MILQPFLYLHSNMVGFKGIKENITGEGFINLHSNMVGFKVV